MRQWLAMETVSCTAKHSPLVAEERPVSGTASRSCGKVRNDNNIEFKTLGLVDRQQTDDIVVLRNNLRFRLADRRIVGAVPQVCHDFIESRCALPRQMPGNLDQLSDICGALRSIFLCQHHYIEIRFANDVLKDLGRRRPVAPLDPMSEEGLENRARANGQRTAARDYISDQQFPDKLWAFAYS